MGAQQKQSDISLSRIPAKYIPLIAEICTELGPKPRFVIVKELQRRCDWRISQKTAMDYVLSAVKGGVLQQVGTNLSLRSE